MYTWVCDLSEVFFMWVQLAYTRLNFLAEIPWILSVWAWTLSFNFASLKWSCPFKVFDKIRILFNSWGSVSSAAVLKLIWAGFEVLLFAFEQVNFHEKYFVCCFSPYGTSSTDKWHFWQLSVKKRILYI